MSYLNCAGRKSCLCGFEKTALFQHKRNEKNEEEQGDADDYVGHGPGVEHIPERGGKEDKGGTGWENTEEGCRDIVFETDVGYSQSIVERGIREQGNQP